MRETSKWDSTSALIFIEINSETKRTDEFPNTVFVKTGTAGNGTLGAIDYINNHTKTTRVYIVSEEKFNVIETNPRKRRV
jgi:hypothetical protein